MIPRELIDSAQVQGGETLKLWRRGGEFSIMLGSNELMNSRMSGSEEALATMTLERVTARAPRVLIGGLGMGFTLRAALGVLGPEARVCVAELVPEVVAWARGPMAEVFGGCLDDPRVEVVTGDVATLIERGGWDAVLLDVDNGPDGIVWRGNDRLYSARGLAVTKRCLTPGGVLAVWSAGSDDSFTLRLRAAGFRVEEVAVGGSKSGRGRRHVIWFAVRPG